MVWQNEAPDTMGGQTDECYSPACRLTCKASSFSRCWRILSVSSFSFSSCVFSFLKRLRGTFCFCSGASHLSEEGKKQKKAQQCEEKHNVGLGSTTNAEMKIHASFELNRAQRLSESDSLIPVVFKLQIAK